MINRSNIVKPSHGDEWAINSKNRPSGHPGEKRLTTVKDLFSLFLRLPGFIQYVIPSNNIAPLDQKKFKQYLVKENHVMMFNFGAVIFKIGYKYNKDGEKIGINPFVYICKFPKSYTEYVTDPNHSTEEIDLYIKHLRPLKRILGNDNPLKLYRAFIMDHEKRLQNVAIERISVKDSAYSLIRRVIQLSKERNNKA